MAAMALSSRTFAPQAFERCAPWHHMGRLAAADVLRIAHIEQGLGARSRPDVSPSMSTRFGIVTIVCAALSAGVSPAQAAIMTKRFSMP
jgi:hypothetical protein